MRYLTLLLLLLSWGCISAAPVPDIKTAPSKGTYVLPVYLKTKRGVESVSIHTESENMCRWIRNNGKRYGSLANVTAIGECQKEGNHELRKNISLGPN